MFSSHKKPRHIIEVIVQGEGWCATIPDDCEITVKRIPERKPRILNAAAPGNACCQPMYYHYSEEVLMPDQKKSKLKDFKSQYTRALEIVKQMSGERIEDVLEVLVQAKRIVWSGSVNVDFEKCEEAIRAMSPDHGKLGND